MTTSNPATDSHEPANKASIAPQSISTVNGQNDDSSPAVDTAGLHGDLHLALNNDSDVETILSGFREVVKRYTSAVGVGHIQRNHEGAWELSRDRATGRLPRRDDFVERFSAACDTTLSRNSIQIEHFLGVQAIYVPVSGSAGRADVLLVLTAAKHASQAIHTLEIASAYLSQFLNSKDQHRNDWKLTSLAALIELVSNIEQQQDLGSACDVVTNELVRHLGTNQVAVGLLRGGQIEIRSLSGTIELDPTSEEYRNMEIALNESLIRNEIGMYPTRRAGDSHLLLAHRQLCASLGVEGVLSCPLRTPVGEVIGAMLMTGPIRLLHGDRLPNFVNASTPRIAGALEVVSRAQRNKLQRLVHWMVTDARSMRSFSWIMLAMMILAIMFVPVQYKVRCSCETESVGRRFAVAPFAGIIDEGFVKEGDQVEKGDLLARLNATEIRWELAGVLAELQQASKRREIELSSRNVTESMLASIEKQRLEARAKLLEHRLDAVEIRSPVSGVVLSGCLDRSHGAAVEVGEVIYEVAPPGALSVEVKVPANEIPRVRVGQPIQVWIDGI
jgi:biotin carboxyl carrier protein